MPAADAPLAARPAAWARPLPLALGGLAGAVMVVLAALSTGVFPVERRPSSWTWSPVVLAPWAGWLCWVAGLALLSGAWIGLHALARCRGSLTVGRVALIGVLWVVPLLAVPPVGSRDVYSYAAHGELASQGEDPGVSPPATLGLTSPFRTGVDRVWRDVVSAYGPASTAVALAAVTAADHEVVRTVVGLRLWMVAGTALLGVGVVVLARHSGTDPVDALVLALLGPLTVVQLVGGAHNEALMAGLMVAGLAVAAARPGPGGAVGGTVLIALGAAVKVPALLAVVYLGWRYDGRPASVWVRAARTLGLLAVAAATLEVVHLATGQSWRWLGGVTAGSNVTTLLSLSTTVGLLLRGPLAALGVDRATTLDGVRNLVQLAGLALAAVLLWRTPKLGLTGLGLALGALALFGASVHPWYLVWALPVLAVAWAGQRATAFVAVSIVVAASTRPQGGGLVRNVGHSPIGVVVLVALGVLAWWWWRHRVAERSDAGRAMRDRATEARVVERSE